jgi:hypothetical protein
MNPKKFDVKKLVTSGAIIPAVVITAIAVVVISVIGFIVVKSVRNKGFLPQPTQLITYECKGIGQPFAMRFRHGMDVVELRSDSVALTGELLNGKIVWSGSPSQVGKLGFMPPTEIVYDDSKSIRLLDGSQIERTCERQP